MLTRSNYSTIPYSVYDVMSVPKSRFWKEVRSGWLKARLLKRNLMNTLTMASLINLIHSSAYDAIDNGLIPDFLLRPAIRFLCRQRLTSLNEGGWEEQHERKMKFIEGLREKPVAIEQSE